MIKDNIRDLLKDCGSLVLERRNGESFWIGEDVRVTVYQRARATDRVKVVIEAPRSTPIVREEIKWKPYEPKINRNI